MRIRLFSPSRDGVTEEQLSAYVDGSLGAAARARIEDRLARSDELRSRLEALKATVAVLRSAELIRAPRSFALTPEMAYGEAKPFRSPGLARISPLMPAMAAAAAAVALGLLLIGNLTGSLRQSGRETRESRGLSIPADGATLAEVTVPAQGGARAEMTAEGVMPVETRVVEKERVAAVPAQPSEAAAPQATVVPAPAGAALKAVQATSEEQAAPPMMAAEMAQASPTPVAAPVAPAPAGPQSAAAPAVTPVETPIAAEKAVAETDAKAAEATPPAPDVLQSTGRGESESGIGLPLWQLEAAMAALVAVLGAVAIAVAIQRRRPIGLP